MSYRSSLTKGITVLGIFGVALLATYYLTNWVINNPEVQSVLAAIGYSGVFILALFTGLNPILPVPAATFTPLFLAAHLSLPLIITALVLGTLTADILGYWFGHWSKTYVIHAHPKIYKGLQKLYRKHRRLVVPVICFYVAFIPLPNEIFLLPLAVLGMKLRHLLLPLIIGNIVNQTLLALGIQNIFWWFG